MGVFRGAFTKQSLKSDIKIIHHEIFFCRSQPHIYYIVILGLLKKNNNASPPSLIYVLIIFPFYLQ